MLGSLAHRCCERLTESRSTRANSVSTIGISECSYRKLNEYVQNLSAGDPPAAPERVQPHHLTSPERPSRRCGTDLTADANPAGRVKLGKNQNQGGVAIPRVRRRLREFRGEPLAGDSRERRGLIQPATGMLGLNRTRRGRVILGTIDCAHVVAGAIGVLHLVAGAAHRGNHAVIAQHLVAHAALTNAGP